MQQQLFVMQNIQNIPVREKVPSSADTEESDSSLSLEARDLRKKLVRKRSRRASDLLVKGRFLVPGMVPGLKELCLQLVYSNKRRYPWQRERIDIGVVSEKHEGMLEHYEGGTRVHVSGDSCILRNSKGQAVAKCAACLPSPGAKSWVIYGTRPIFAGTKASCREGNTNFYPWYQARLCNDGTLSLEIYKSYQCLWFSEQTMESDTITFKNAVDQSIAAELMVDQDLLSVTVAKGVDPAVMINLALCISRMKQ